MGADGYYSSPFSKHFNRAFEDACRECHVPEEVMDAIQGHGEEGNVGKIRQGSCAANTK